MCEVFYFQNFLIIILSIKVFLVSAIQFLQNNLALFACPEALCLVVTGIISFLTMTLKYIQNFGQKTLWEEITTLDFCIQYRLQNVDRLQENFYCKF
jgi:hypothetical protein